MQNWLKISLVLSTFGFFKEFRPSEHFIYDFLVGPWRNITEEGRNVTDIISQDVYPVATYSYLAQLFVVFLITDLCRYKPLIVVLGMSGIAVFSMLLWTTSLLALQILEAIYGTMMATEVAYYTYMYAKVPKDKYQQVTGHSRAGILLGRFSSGVVGQLLISYKVMDPRTLTYLSFGALIIGTVWALFLPPVSTSIYFHRGNETEVSFKQKWAKAFKLLYKHFISSYSIIHVVKWSVWFALATCGFLFVQNYMQPLWTTVKPSGGSGVYNGAVEAVLTILGAMGALVAGFINTDWKVIGEFSLGICSVIEGVVLLVASQAEEVFICYVAYIIFGALYHFMITIATSEVAKHILEDSYGLVFGLNTFLALVLQTILIILVISDSGLGYGKYPRSQFLVYGGYFMAIGIIFLIMSLWNYFKYCKSKRTQREEINPI